MSVCVKCKKRHENCHSSCAEYNRERQINKQIELEREKELMLTGYEVFNFNHHKRGKGIVEEYHRKKGLQ